MSAALAQWVLQTLLFFAPPERAPQLPGFEESVDETRSRYAAIAEDIAAAAEAPEKTSDGLSDQAEAALLVAIAIGETMLASDVDEGSPGCYRGKPGGAWWSRCDAGTSATLWQLKPIKWEGELVTYREHFKDRARSARIALWIARSSLSMCRKLPAIDHLSALSGSCREGLEAPRARYRLWQKIRAWQPAE